MNGPRDLGGIERFEAFCRRKEHAAVAAVLPGFHTVYDGTSGLALREVGNDWSRALFDGNFFRSDCAREDLPLVNLAFVQSRDGNTGADDPASLGGGETDKHLVYEGLSRVDADAVMAGATTARGNEIMFSVWHPQLVALRRSFCLPRHPAQVIVTDRGDLPTETGLMFQSPDLRVFIVASSRARRALVDRLSDRPSVVVLDAGEPLSLTRGLRDLHAHGIRAISAVGGRRTATTLLREHLVQDLYLTTSPIPGGHPDTPFYEGPPLTLTRVLADME
jgi:riboflavin biosynthesis pyrimidine reductase